MRSKRPQGKDPQMNINHLATELALIAQAKRITRLIHMDSLDNEETLNEIAEIIYLMNDRVSEIQATKKVGA
jgi:hypothetical protein